MEVENKKCSNCLEDKNISEFFRKPNGKVGYLSICKVCHSKKARLYREKNSNKLKEYKKVYREENRDIILQREKEYRDNLDKEKVSEYNKEYFEKNKERLSEKKKEYYLENREYFLDKQREYNKENKELIKLKTQNYKNRRNELRNIRRKSDILFQLECRIRSLFYSTFKLSGFSKNSRTNVILGISYDEFKIHLESKFDDWMTWDNRGLYNGEFDYGWDIDHIIPSSSANTVEELLKLNHYSNLQPLCSKINRDIKKDNL